MNDTYRSSPAFAGEGDRASGGGAARMRDPDLCRVCNRKLVVPQAEPADPQLVDPTITTGKLVERALEAITAVRHRAAASFEEGFTGIRGQAYDRAVLDCYDAVRALKSLTPRPERVPGWREKGEPDPHGEREEIVAWLHACALSFRGAAPQQEKPVGWLVVACEEAANAIERGEHLSIRQPPPLAHDD